MYMQVESMLFHYSQPKDMYYDQVLADSDKKKEEALQQQPKHR